MPLLDFPFSFCFNLFVRCSHSRNTVLKVARLVPSQVQRGCSVSTETFPLYLGRS